MPKNLAKIAAIAAAFALALGAAGQAQAFYFSPPKTLEQALAALKASRALAQEGEGTMAPAPMMGPTEPAPMREPVPMTAPTDQPTQPMPPTDGQPQPMPPQNMESRGEQSPGMYQPQPPTAGGQGQMGSQGQDNRGPDNERMLKDVKRGVTSVERQLKQFETMTAKLEKQGLPVSENVKNKISALKELIAKFKAVNSAEEMQEINTDDLWQNMRELEEERQNIERTSNVLREMRRIESGVKMFEKQIAKLTKQKVAMPENIAANLEKVKTIIAAIKGGSTENAEDIFEAIQELDQNRGQLEALSRWPQTIKEMDREIKNLTREMKRAKTIADRLTKKGMDLSGAYAEFEAAVNKLKETRDAAVAKMQAGESEEAFELVQNDFFGQMEDTWQGHKVIMTMSNFGRFSADFNREIAQAQRQIKTLEKKKLDTSALKDLLSRAKEKGAEVKELFKAKPLDPDSVISALEELEDLAQEFDKGLAELTGEEEEMPWEKGPQQFRSIEVSPTLQKLIPRKSEQTGGPEQPMNNPQQ